MEESQVRTTRFGFALTVFTLLTGALLTSASSALAAVSAVPSHLGDCYKLEPQVIAEELPPIYVPGQCHEALISANQLR